MDDEISSCLVSIKERYRNVSSYLTKQYPCHLKTVNVHGLELLESVLEKDSGILGEVRQVRIPYNRLFNPIYGVKPNSTASRKVILIQGEAAVGKTMLCFSIVEEWASGKLFQEFQLVLLLPLNSRNVASASSLSGLLNVLYADLKGDYTCSTVAKYLTERKSHYNNILLIADGWEELHDSQCQAGSFLHSLLFSSDIIPSSSITVLITSQPGCCKVQMLKFMQSANDRLITLTGFDRRAIESVVQSEFAGDLRRIRYLTAQLKDNPLVANACSTPLNLAIVCHTGDAEPLPNTMTKLYSNLIWTLASASITHPHENSLQFSSHHDLPEELQQSWWQVCEIAFRNVEKGHNIFPPSDEASKLNEISCFGLTKPIAETEDTLSFSFIHPHFQEYLAALHLAKQPKEAQIKFMHEFIANEECKSKMAITFWQFFVTNYAHRVANLNPDVVDQVLKTLLAAYCTTKQEYFVDLCHLSYEAKHDIVNQKVVEAISIMGTGVLRFSHASDVYDFNSMVYVLQNITQESEVEINFQNCNLRPERLNHLANTLCKKSSIVQIKGLDLSGNRFSNSLAVDFFRKAAVALKSLKVLILRNCDIGTTLDIKAIISALTESTSPTLTHFDLSFNRISISFLQVLQQHLESYDTFESLQNLGLKGSLNSDVSINFLANFSDTLSSKCVRLRRLDLSENNLGEPGNPDLSKVISQLLSLGRDFNLCLNDEYMSKVHDEFVCVMEESIRKKGTINHTIAHGVIVGPGRSGKNTLMSRLMGNGPPKSDTVSPSTGVLESIVKVEVKKLSTVATAVSNLEWKKLQYDEEALELIMTTARHHSATTTISKQIVTKYIIKEQTESPTITSAKSPIPSNHLGGPKHKTKHKIVNLFKKLKMFKVRKSGQDPVDEKVKGAIVYAPDVEPVDIFKQAVKLRGMDALREHLESSWSLYLTNTGGQIEFQEHLPLLVCGPSIFFVTFPLHHDLDKPYDVRYEFPDGRVETYKSPGSLLQELLQTLATISASHFTSGQQRDSEAPIKPKIFFVGTHKDCLPANCAEEIIQRKDELLQNCVRQTALFAQDAIQFAEHPKQLIFAVNNLSDDDDEFQKIRSAVQTTVERDEFTIECPSSWLLLSLILRAKHKSDQVLTFDKCFSIARECGISDRKELTQALSFIHSRLGLVRYFDVKDLNTLVVIDPQVLFDKITDLIVKTFTVENVGVKKNEDFCQRGIIPVTVMQNISDKDENGSDSQLPFKWLTNLLNYLRIAALFKDRDGDKYFFPSALCHAPKSHSNVPHAYLSPSLLVGFKSGFCPRGIPGALIKYLMTNEMRSKRCWNIIPNKVFKNEVSFAIQACGNIKLRILPTHLEISYYSETDSTEEASEEDSKEDVLMKKTCEMAYMQIKKAMSTVTSQCMECSYFFGFYCTLSTCEAHRHPAQLEWDGRDPFKVVCKVANKRGNLPKGYIIWNLQKKRKPGKEQLDKVIDGDDYGALKHLGRFAESMTEWEGRISDELKLTPADVESIHIKHPRNLKLQSREALYIWKQRLGPKATYRRLMNVFERADFQNYAEIVRSIILCEDESEVDDSSDYEDLQPIPQPETYPNVQSNPPPSPKHSRRVSSCDEYLLINPATADNFPKDQVHNQKILDSRDVSVVPMLSSKHKPTTAAPVPPPKTETPLTSYPTYIGLYDYDPRVNEDLGFKNGDLMYIITNDNDDWWWAHLKDSGKEGFVPNNYVTEYWNGLYTEKWFFGRIKREDAKKQLMSQINSYGSYLVRVESESTPESYELSVRDRDQVKHYKIHHSEKFIEEFFITVNSAFKTVQDLITHHQQYADGLCVNLRKPCEKPPIVDILGQSVDEWQIPRKEIRLIRKIMDTQFVTVSEGVWNDSIPVAVKVLKPNRITTQDFLQAANLTKKLIHPHIVCFYGLCSMEEPVYVITEFMKHGNLLDYFGGEGKSLKLPQLIDIAAQVASGMAYLEKHNVIHRNLKARNIQVGEGISCKVANFEPARVMDEGSCFYMGHKGDKLSMKWTAPEAALLSMFSIKSDVWSFGVILYEIITYGRPPYPGISNHEVPAKIEQGYRMPQQPECPEKLYDMMLNCWRQNPNDRPTFATLQRELTSGVFTGDRANAS